MVSRYGAAIVASACLGGAVIVVAEDLVVRQVDRTFMPAAVRVAAGRTVAITNDDQVVHHLYVDTPAMKFDSGEQAPGQPVPILFDKSGRFAVRCLIHPRMRLDVVVDP